MKKLTTSDLREIYRKIGGWTPIDNRPSFWRGVYQDMLLAIAAPDITKAAEFLRCWGAGVECAKQIRAIARQRGKGKR